MAHSGFLNVNKPSGVTSRWVVDQVQRLVRPGKVGHAGTLDPLATGVLVVAIGQATRLIEYVQQSCKTYRGTFLLGRTSDTEDVEGHVQMLDNPPMPTVDEIESVAATMIGEIQQRPPVYSAIKVAGERSYDLARAGKAVELAVRPVTVHSLRVVDYSYPALTIHVECGAGTYIRTLGRELAERCGTSAVMSGLARTAVGAFSIDDALDPNALSVESIAATMRPPVVAITHLPRLTVSTNEAARLRNGQRLLLQSVAEASQFAALDETGDLIAILERVDEELQPVKVFQ